jgi:phosphatidylethanolamine/phosphatidyl-N-methylethanolamine N-methyltransferase
MQQTKAVKEGELFFRQWLRSPKSMGSLIPSSKFLARAMAEEVAWEPGQWVVELGGGTGSISLGLVERGIPRDRLVVIELDPDLHRYLRDRLPGSLVINGDATKLADIMRDYQVGEVGTVISGLPMVGMPFEFQRSIIEQGFKAVRPGGFMLQYSYSPVAPIPARRLGVRAQLVRRVALNFPPAFVWRYRHLAAVAPNGASA